MVVAEVQTKPAEWKWSEWIERDRQRICEIHVSARTREVRAELVAIADRLDAEMIALEDYISYLRDWLDVNRENKQFGRAAHPKWEKHWQVFNDKWLRWHAELGELRDQAKGMAKAW